jgi:hypothetical protein
METERLIKQFIKDYKYGGCIMYGTDKDGLFVLWKHWSYLNPELQAKRIYIGKIKISLKLTYKWLD